MSDFLFNPGGSKKLGLYTAARLSSKMSGVIFREQLEGNTALNAHLEINVNDIPRFIGIKIFGSAETQKTPKGYVCSGATEILAYWFQHSIPVIIMVFDSSKIFWQSVTADNIEILDAQWEITVPYEQIFNEESIKEIGNLTCTSPYLARLAIDKSWIELLANDEEILIEMDEWINQPSQKGSLKLITTQNKKENSIYNWQFNVNPDMPQIMRIPELFPWANVINDKNFFRAKITNLGELDENLNNENFDENILMPYSIEGGEIAKFRLKLTLNDLGKAFLIAEPFICKGIFQTQNNSTSSISFGSGYEDSLKFKIFHNH